MASKLRLKSAPKLPSSAGGYSSSISIPRRSNGEKGLLKDAGKSLLLPEDEAFHRIAIT